MSLEMLPSIAVTLFVILGVTLGALFGLLRGFKRSIVTLIGTITAAVLSFIISPMLASFATKTALTYIDISAYVTNYNEIVEASPAIEELISVLPAAIIAPILFMVLFIILKLIIKIPCGIISLYMGKKSELRAIGLPLGAIQGLVSSLVFVFIITGLVGVADNIAEPVLKDSSSATAEIRETVKMVDGYIEEVKKDPVVNLVSGSRATPSQKTLNVNIVFSKLSAFKFRNEKVELGNELINIADAAVSILPVMSNSDVAKWTDEEIRAIEAFADKLSNSDIIINIGTDVVAGVSNKWSKDESFMGLERPHINETVDPLMSSLFVSLKDTNTNTIREDIDTVVEILKTIHAHGVLQSFSGDNASDNLLKALSGDFVSDLLKVLSQNERFDILVPEVTNLGLRLLATALELPENTAEVYQDTVTKISDSLTTVLSAGITEESVSQFSTEMKDTLASNGINISDEVSTEVANAIVNSFANETQITPEKIEEYFRDFATVYSAMEGVDVEQTGKNTSGSTNLNSEDKQNVDPRSTYDTEGMSYTDMLQVLSSLGIYDYYNSIHDISNGNNTLSNGKTATEYVTYIIGIINTVGANYDNIGKMGSGGSNPLISMGSADTLITTKITTEDLLVNSDMKLTDEDIEQFGKGFEAITQFIDSYSKMEGDLSLDNIGDLDIAAAGKALDALKSVSALSKTVDNISNAVVSTVVGSNVDIAGKLEEGGSSYEELFVTVQSTAQVISNITKPDADLANSEEAILELLISLTPGTAGVVNEIITEDLIIKQGAPAESASAAVKALREAFVKMANLTGEQHDSEAAYITKMFNLALSVKDDGEADGIIGENGMFKSEDELVDMSLNSVVASAALKAITVDANGDPIYDALNVAGKISDANKENIVNSLENIYNENKVGMTAEELADLEGKILSISYLLNLELDFMN